MEEQGNKLKTSNLMHSLLIIFAIHSIATLLVYKFFGFEVGIIFGISLSTAIISTGFVGVENIIIKKNN